MNQLAQLVEANSSLIRLPCAYSRFTIPLSIVFNTARFRLQGAVLNNRERGDEAHSAIVRCCPVSSDAEWVWCSTTDVRPVTSAEMLVACSGGVMVRSPS